MIIGISLIMLLSYRYSKLPDHLMNSRTFQAEMTSTVYIMCYILFKKVLSMIHRCSIHVCLLFVALYPGLPVYTRNKGWPSLVPRLLPVFQYHACRKLREPGKINHMFEISGRDLAIMALHILVPYAIQYSCFGHFCV